MSTHNPWDTRSAGEAFRYAFEGERDIHEGSGHAGKSYVTQFIARR